jgi:hypothetical protein
MSTQSHEVHSPDIVRMSMVKLEETQGETHALVIQAQEFLIDSDEKLIVAQERVAEAHRRKKFLEGVFAPMKASAKVTADAAKATLKEVTELIEKATGPCEEVKQIYSQKSVAYHTKQEATRQAEARAREIAAKKAAEERALEEAQHAQDMGDSKTADEILDEGAAFDPPPPPVAPIPQAEGVRFTEYWSAKGEDLMALVKVVAKGKQAVTLLRFDDVALNQKARAEKGAMNVPGVRVYCEKKMAPTGR